MTSLTKQRIAGIVALVIVLSVISLFLHNLQPVSAAQDAAPVIFEVKQGDGFRTVAQNLFNGGVIRSRLAFEFYSLLTGKAPVIKPGLYRLSPSMSVMAVASDLTGASAGEATVTIPEGSNIYEIDRILSNALIIKPGTLINFHDDGNIEGKLFPDTYEFYTDANVKGVVQEFLDNFTAKAMPVLAADQKDAGRNLIIASLLEKEVPDPGDQAIVAGIINKRLAEGIPLDIDATVCYAKLMQEPDPTAQTPQNLACYPLSPLDFKINSPYNTYLYKGLPPGPIGNPGVSAIDAAEHPSSSPYLYYLSDPATGKTIFAKTLDEQNQNKVKYLEDK